MTQEKTFLKSGSITRVLEGPYEAKKKLDVAVYALALSDEGYFLKTVKNFELPSKLYGNPKRLVNRFINTFSNRQKNLGILLTGYKGTGKSVTAKMLCIEANLPVILINDSYSGTGLQTFLSSIDQEVIVFVDEFEKVYREREDQDKLLTLLDGVYTARKIWLFTCNETGNLPNAMINRPGRIHYLIDYQSLEDDVIEDIIDDNLKNKKWKADLASLIRIQNIISIDTIISLINEMNLYDESPKQALQLMNISPESTSFTIRVAYDGQDLDKDWDTFTLESFSDLRCTFDLRGTVYNETHKTNRQAIRKFTVETILDAWRDQCKKKGVDPNESKHYSNTMLRITEHGTPEEPYKNLSYDHVLRLIDEMPKWEHGKMFAHLFTTIFQWTEFVFDEERGDTAEVKHDGSIVLTHGLVPKLTFTFKPSKSYSGKSWVM